MTLHTYLPQDRLRALMRGTTLPDFANGSALFADISGFTPLTEKLTFDLGARRGIDELILRINSVYDALIREVDLLGGSVVSFAGDAITCWFDASGGEAPIRAVICARALQAVMQRIPDLSLKVAVSTGSVRRFVTGNPEVRLIDVLAGAMVTRLATADHLAGPGEILIDQETREALQISALDSRSALTGERFFVFDPSLMNSERYSIPDNLRANTLPAQLDTNLLKAWTLPMVYERESIGRGVLLTELRPTTAVFIRFMGIDYDHDDQAQEKLDQVISQTQGILERYEGDLLELTIGDKGSYIYAAFGASHIHEDDARRAVRVSLELRQLLDSFTFLESIQFGVSSGTMRVGAYGGTTRQSFGALGDDVNLAARLMTMAVPGEVLISGRVRKVIAEEFLVEARPPMAIKGKTEPVPVFAVLGTEKFRAIRLQEPTYALPMIGRQAEISLLKEKLSSVLQGQGQILGITAEAGMGKSRLVAEGIRLARRSRLLGYGGVCQSDGMNTPYLVWRAIWSALFDLDPLLALRKQIRSLEGELEDRAPEHMDALPLLGTVLGLPFPENDFTRTLEPKDRKARLETVLVKCLVSSAREAAEDGGGLLLVLEDLHWIDPVSFNLLEQVARAIENLPVLILLTYRPSDDEVQQHKLSRLEQLKYFAQTRLTELSEAETGQVIRSKLSNLFPERTSGASPHLIERITNLAQGNPFYAEELLNYLHDRGVDPGDDTALDALELPTSLHSLILSRIDQLTASQQLSLKVASIIGRVFAFADLHTYYPPLGTAEQLEANMHELERLDLTPLETREPELIYLFKHLVTHEVGYESLAYATRAQLHGQYARYLESKYAERTDQFAPQLAHHYERAQIQDKARFYLSKSGEQAAANYANDEALAYFNRVLQLTPAEDIRARFDTLLKRERIYDLIGKRTEQRQDLAELARLADQFEEAPLLRARVAIRQAKLEIDVGEYAAARSRAQAAIWEIEANAQPGARATELQADALLLEARAMFLAGEAAAAGPQLESALLLARKHHYVRGEYNSLAQLGLLNWHMGDYSTAISLLGQALDQIRQAGDVRRELDILNNLGIVLKSKSMYSEAISHYEKAQQIARKIGDRSGEATLLTNMGSACLTSGDFVRAGIYSEQAAAMAAEVNEPTLQGIALTNRGEAYRELGQYDLANTTAARALTLVRSYGYRRGEAIVLDNIGLIEFSLGNLQQALDAAHAAVTTSKEIGASSTEAGALIHLGLILTEMEQFDAAEQAFTSARNILQGLDEELTMMEVKAGLANLMLARGKSDDLDQAWNNVVELLPALLPESPGENLRLLPMWLYLTCIRVMQARQDPRAGHLIARAEAELRARGDRIQDNILRQGYLKIPEHSILLTLADTIPPASI